MNSNAMDNLWSTLPDLLNKITWLKRVLRYRNGDTTTRNLLADLCGHWPMRHLKDKYEPLSDIDMQRMIILLEADLDDRLSRLTYTY